MVSGQAGTLENGIHCSSYWSYRPTTITCAITPKPKAKFKRISGPQTIYQKLRMSLENHITMQHEFCFFACV